MTERSFFHNIRFVGIRDNIHHIISATLKELETLPGIGPKLAQAIIDGCLYKKVEDLLKVKGIGEKKLAKIKDLMEVKPHDLFRKGDIMTSPPSRMKFYRIITGIGIRRDN